MLTVNSSSVTLVNSGDPSAQQHLKLNRKNLHILLSPSVSVSYMTGSESCPPRYLVPGYFERVPLSIAAASPSAPETRSSIPRRAASVASGRAPPTGGKTISF
ncbi:UNVERIFIED_CONTAM: hypothetical protein K2H54_048375 [Gekko kuhli]